MTYLIKSGGISEVGSDQITDGAIVNADIASDAGIDATKIASGNISNTLFGYLSGLTAGIQTQLDDKEEITYGTFTPNIFLTGSNGDTVPTYFYTAGRYLFGTNFKYAEYHAWNSTGGTPGSGSVDRLSLELPSGFTVGTLYSQSPTVLGIAYETTITFYSYQIECFLSAGDEELYLYKRSSATALSTFTANDQGSAVRGFRLGVLCLNPTA